MSLEKTAHFIERFFYPVVKGVNFIGILFLLTMMFLTVVDVTGRVFRAPITGSYEMTEFMLALLVFFSIAYTQIEKGHITMDVLMARFSKRTQAIVESFVTLISLGLVSVLTWQLVAHGKRLWLGENVTGVLHLPIYPVVFAVAFGSLLFSVVLFVDFLISLSKVRKQ